MTTLARTGLRIVAHAICLPWASVPLLWLMEAVGSQPEAAGHALITFHNRFMHGPYGWPAWGVSVLALAVACACPGKSWREILALVLYGLILAGVALYTLTFGIIPAGA